MINLSAAGMLLIGAFASPAATPALMPRDERLAIELDWRKQDGLGTGRAPVSHESAIRRVMESGDALLRDLEAQAIPLTDLHERWRALHLRFHRLTAAGQSDEVQWEELWREVHWARRAIVFCNPLAQTGPLLFVKQAPSIFSHQLTQYYGSCARPGGGLFILDQPGVSLRCRQLAAGALPVGSYQHPELSADGRRILFAYCPVPSVPVNREQHLDRFFHLYEMNTDGSGLRQLTSGSFDDFSPRYLPDGRLVFVSTRRGGFHRCGRGPCPTYTLAVSEADGSNPHPISFHETHEWDPAVLPDGRVLYTRWDYVDRHAVFYEQLWTTRPDGSGVSAFYGNNTFNPVGVWEARPVPGTSRIMATAAAHHAMTAGSIILLDIDAARDGLSPITRLTPDAPFPESEIPVANHSNPRAWFNPVGVKAGPLPAEAVRWPGHCYRAPHPLSEKYFLAAYSFDALIGEPDTNPANMFGLYLVDCWGNKELLHRDPEISSLWAVPMAPRTAAPRLASALDPESAQEGRFFVENVHTSWPALPAGSIKRLRVLQVLPKTTPHANEPTVGLANASPGKQVLGTVPVEEDGSAYFRAPARVALVFQALDDAGQAVQVMRSVVYLQPGETASCIGCHEYRHTAPTSRRAIALTRAPSPIEPGPEGSRPFSYARLVQPVLERHCVRCHNPGQLDGKVILTGEPQGQYSASYLALAPLVSFSSWGGKAGDFRVSNSEPISQPGFFGARGSRLTDLLRKGHHDVALPAADLDRLITWMDANALFYGTFDPVDQRRQLRGELIAGPKLD